MDSQIVPDRNTKIVYDEDLLVNLNNRDKQLIEKYNKKRIFDNVKNKAIKIFLVGMFFIFLLSILVS